MAECQEQASKITMGGVSSVVANIQRQATLLLDKQLSFQRTPSKNNGGGVIASHDDRSHINSSELQVDSRSQRSRNDRHLESAGGISSAISPISVNRKSRFTNTPARNSRPELKTTSKLRSNDEINLRENLIRRFNNFIPAHAHDQTEKRFENSSVKEMKGAI